MSVRWHQTKPMLIRRAASDDLGRIASLLQTAGLQPLSSGLPRANVLVALEDDAVIGVIALQVTGLSGLVFPPAVGPPDSGDDVRNSLIQALLARSHELSLRKLYLLTEGDEAFFAEVGFVPIADEVVPWQIRSSRAYRDQRSETATLMQLKLVSRFV